MGRKIITIVDMAPWNKTINPPAPKINPDAVRARNELHLFEIFRASFFAGPFGEPPCVVVSAPAASSPPPPTRVTVVRT